jgi:hypothetical protein
MGDIGIHIEEMLARNARSYLDKIALVEKNPTEKNGSPNVSEVVQFPLYDH